MDQATWLWLVQRAAEHHGGDVDAAAGAVFAAVRDAETAGEDPWERLTRLAAARPWPPYRVPVRYILEFAAYWDDKPEATGADVVEQLRRSLTRRPGDEEAR